MLARRIIASVIAVNRVSVAPIRGESDSDSTSESTPIDSSFTRAEVESSSKAAPDHADAARESSATSIPSSGPRSNR